MPNTKNRDPTRCAFIVLPDVKVKKRGQRQRCITTTTKIIQFHNNNQRKYLEPANTIHFWIFSFCYLSIIHTHLLNRLWPKFEDIPLDFYSQTQVPEILMFRNICDKTSASIWSYLENADDLLVWSMAIKFVENCPSVKKSLPKEEGLSWSLIRSNKHEELTCES